MDAAEGSGKITNKLCESSGIFVVLIKMSVVKVSERQWSLLKGTNVDCWQKHLKRIAVSGFKVTLFVDLSIHLRPLSNSCHTLSVSGLLTTSGFFQLHFLQTAVITHTATKGLCQVNKTLIMFRLKNNQLMLSFVFQVLKCQIVMHYAK